MNVRFHASWCPVPDEVQSAPDEWSGEEGLSAEKLQSGPIESR
ncbi:MAG TPA: hypothetical protein PLB02_03310 [Thermoanaerobaculia bacterium]|nr:hypothetical protein [Thermoanaerobaculia bacterium]HQR66401.1 hypothetical protein [Thermoanaerobaculia bacterium]